ncbi:MAG: hypothetical protein ACJ75S_12840 [Solirubrobacterales bacterium]
MIGEGIRPSAALVAAVLAIGSLAACGGSGSDTTSSASSTDTTASQPVSKQPGPNGSGSGASQANSKKNGGSGESSSSVETAPLKVSGGGSAQYRVKDGDNSIQEFGEESDEPELEEAAASLHDFYVARAEEDWPAACSHLAKTVIQQLKQLASQSDKLAGKGCAGILSALTPPLPSKAQKELTIVDAGSLRTEDERAFLIYRGAEGTTYAISMAQEDGAWKVGGLAATPLS